MGGAPHGVSPPTRTGHPPGSRDIGADTRYTTLLDMMMSQAVPSGFTGAMVRPGDAGYEHARRVWNGAIDRRPAFIARCRSSADVAAMVRFGVRQGLAVAVRG